MKRLQLSTAIQTALNFQTSVDANLPEWLLLVPAGRFTGRDGRTFINDRPEIVIAFIQEKERDLVMDVNHSSELKAPAGEEAPARGWFGEYDIREGAIWGRIEWNSIGKALIENREYRFYSPALLHDAQGRVRGIASVGLTNKHNLKELPSLNNEQGDSHMKLHELIALALGLNAETATVDEAVTAINTMKGNLQTALNNEGKVDPSKFIPIETHQLALNRAEEAENQIAEAGKAKRQERAETLIDQAIEDGKIAPANREHYLGLCQEDVGFTQVETLLASAPKVLADDTDLDGKKPADQSVSLNAEQEQIDSIFGNSAEEVAQHNS